MHREAQLSSPYGEKYKDFKRISEKRLGQTNEILAKCLCNNLCVLVQEAFEIGIDIDFKKCAEMPIAHN